MLDQIFGGEVPTAVRFVIAFGVVLALIAITFVALRKFAGRKLPLSNGGRARQPRLGVLDAFAIDSRRRLVLIRRDNVEHLIMIGGPNDVLVESEIVRNPAQAGLTPAPAQAPAPRAQTRPGEAVRAPIGAPPPAPMSPQHRPLPFASDAPPAAEPAAPPAPSRSLRMPFQRERATSSGATATPPASLPPAANVPLSPPPAMARTIPPRVRAPEPVEAPEETAAAPQVQPPAPRPKSDVDPLYADIEKKLGEALSRSPAAPPARPTAPASAPPPAARRPEPVEAPPAPQPQGGSKSHLDALEEEMANLLGRDRP